MQPFTYKDLNKVQKLALFLIVIGPEVASEILKQFDDDSVDLVCREMVGFSVIDEDTQREVLEEMSSVILSSYGSLLGGPGFARRVLELAKGDYKATNLLDRIAPAGTSAEVIREIGEMEPRQVFNIIKTEQCQTIAFVLSYLDVDKAAVIISMFNPELREEVIERLGTMESTSLELVTKVARALNKNFDSKEKSTMHRSGGVRTVAELLNALEKDSSKAILTKIEERNPTLGATIRKKMFSFNDLIRLDLADLQRIMREVDSNDLVVALKSASPTLRDSILEAVSKRAAETLREELDMLGPVRVKDVEAAQDRIIQVVRRLEEQEEISLDKGGARVIG
ncbi:MAG: flagellar motor switch protein FliG [Puniceicoccaceae bacterium]|nr:MAG: flagellar motor switch protein FliG [Puniceicoccaceae bacterium]